MAVNTAMTMLVMEMMMMPLRIEIHGFASKPAHGIFFKPAGNLFFVFSFVFLSFDTVHSMENRVRRGEEFHPS